MNRRFLSLCGMIAPVVFLFTAILGGAMRPGYSHMSDTVSELFSPGSPNKPLLDTLHTTFALLMMLFGIGVLLFVLESKRSTRASVLGASLFIVTGVLSVATATVFPQDAWGSPPTFRGQMHIRVSGVLSLLSLLSMVLIAMWIDRTGLFPGFKTYSFITAGLVVLAAVFFAASAGGPIMGLAERITILIGFQWTFVLALWTFSQQEKATKSRR
jgi:hypothetical membrane protein